MENLPREEGVGHRGHAHGSTGVTRVGLGDNIGGQDTWKIAKKQEQRRDVMSVNLLASQLNYFAAHATAHQKHAEL